MDKEPLTYEEQLDRLIMRGIVKTEKSLEILQKYSYYSFINRYKQPFIRKSCKDKHICRNAKKDKTAFTCSHDYQCEIYHEGTTLEQIEALYLYDHRLRQIYLNYTLELEQYLRHIVAYEFMHSLKETYPIEEYYKDNFYLHPRLYEANTFDELLQIAQVIQKFNKIRNSQDEELKHYKKYYQYVPLWVAMHVFSFGDLNKYYQILPSTVKDIVLERLIVITPTGLTQQTRDEFQQIIKACAELRNACAHNDEIYNRRFAKMSLSIVVQKLEILITVVPHLKEALHQAKADHQAALHKLHQILQPNLLKRINKSSFLPLSHAA